VFCERYLSDLPLAPFLGETDATASPAEEDAAASRAREAGWLSAAAWVCVDELQLTRHADFAAYSAAVDRHYSAALRGQQQSGVTDSSVTAGAVCHLIRQRTLRPGVATMGPESITTDAGRVAAAAADATPTAADTTAETIVTAQVFIGKLLPSAVRSLVWQLALQRQRQEDAAAHAAHVWQVLAQGVQARAGAGAAASTPVGALAARAVRARVGCLTAAADTPDGRRQAAAVLALAELYYVYSGEYHPRHIPLLFPFVAALLPPNKAAIADAAHALLPAWVTFVATWAPTPAQAAAAATRVLETVAVADPELHRHLATATARGALGSQDVLARLLEQQQQQQQQQQPSVPGAEGAEVTVRAIVQPAAFVRRWMGEGFVGVLAPPAVSYVWDQCALLGVHVLEEFGMAVLLLLRQQVLRARDYDGVRHALLHCPCELYTANVAAAWLHLRAGLPPGGVPALNELEPGIHGLVMQEVATAAADAFSHPGIQPGLELPVANHRGRSLRLRLTTPVPPRSATATFQSSSGWARGYEHHVFALPDLYVDIPWLSLAPTAAVGPRAQVTAEVSMHVADHVLAHAARPLLFVPDADGWACTGKGSPALLAGLAAAAAEVSPLALREAELLVEVYANGRRIGLAEIGLYQPLHRRPRAVDWHAALGRSHRCLAVPSGGGWEITESFGTVYVGAAPHLAPGVWPATPPPALTPYYEPPLWRPTDTVMAGKKGRDLAAAAVCCAVTVPGARWLPDNVLAARVDVIVVSEAWKPLVSAVSEFAMLSEII